MTQDERDQIRSLEQGVADQAERYLAHPTEGLAAGYRPGFTEFRSRELGSPNPVMRQRTRADWLRAIAERDLRGWRWEILPTLGGGAIRIRPSRT